MKVTDKRMFTAEGELREEYRRELAESRASPEPPPAAAPQPEPPPAPQPLKAAVDEKPERPPIELPPSSDGLGAPTFFDLIGVLADPISLYLGDAKLPDGRSLENLEMARLHIDLLDQLRQKTRGNLTSQELAVLEDLLYRARVRYVQKRG